MMDDREIIQLYKDRSEKAITETASQYGPYCYSIIYRILKNEEDTRECFNDVCYRVWNTIPPADPPDLRLFLGKISRCRALDRLRQRDAQKRGGAGMTFFSEMVDYASSPDDTISEAERRAIAKIVNRFLHTLNDRDRWMFVRRYWYMSSVKQIAKALDIKESTVKMALSRARNRLSEELRKEGFDYG